MHTRERQRTLTCRWISALYQILLLLLLLLLLKLQRYDLRVKYTPGKLLVATDTLSHANSTKPDTKSQEDEQDVTAHVNMVIENMPIADSRIKQIQQETAKDQELYPSQMLSWMDGLTANLHVPVKQ